LADLSDLRRFGVALARDDRFVSDHASAAALVDRLFRQASLEAVGAGVRDEADQGPRDDARVRAFGQFVRLHRRHVRRLSLDDGEPAWDENWETVHRNARTGEIGIAAAVRALPLELREPLLIVVLAGFTHREAAAALDLPLAVVVDRLVRARTRLAAHMAAARDTAAAWPQSAHLRIVK